LTDGTTPDGAAVADVVKAYFQPDDIGKLTYKIDKKTEADEEKTMNVKDFLELVTVDESAATVKTTGGREPVPDLGLADPNATAMSNLDPDGEGLININETDPVQISEGKASVAINKALQDEKDQWTKIKTCMETFEKVFTAIKGDVTRTVGPDATAFTNAKAEFVQ
jgi:hypothetical protein